MRIISSQILWTYKYSLRVYKNTNCNLYWNSTSPNIPSISLVKILTISVSSSNPYDISSLNWIVYGSYFELQDLLSSLAWTDPSGFKVSFITAYFLYTSDNVLIARFDRSRAIPNIFKALNVNKLFQQSILLCGRIPNFARKNGYSIIKKIHSTIYSWK